MKSFVDISTSEWLSREKQLKTDLFPITDAFLKRRQVGKKHAVHDFLFTYYNLSPQKLIQWVPSYNQVLELAPDSLEQYPWLNTDWFFVRDQKLFSNIKKVNIAVVETAEFILELCKNVLAEPPKFGCYGLHEWAMVYQQEPHEIRHEKLPLRMTGQAIAAFVESQTLRCTHYDAYRFFTKNAKPLNIHIPTLDARVKMEQPGCLHANMDLYKWSTKLWPWIGSDFIAKTFFYALEGRTLDMRASPYDLRSLNYEPICIETEEGRRVYAQEQMQYSKKSTALREKLKKFCEKFLSDVS